MRKIAVRALLIPLSVLFGCAPASDLDDASSGDVEASESALSSCVAPSDHWSFWADCAEDVGLGPGAAVHAFAPGEVVGVYGSCLGFAGQSIRLEGSSGRTMYSHVDTSLKVGDVLAPGDYIGTVFSGAGQVFCAEDWSSCGIGKTAARPMLCWSGPHLHREGACCGTEPVGTLLRNQHSDRCAEIASYSVANGGAAVQWGCHGEANQRWQYVDAGGGFYELRNAHSGKCLEVYGWDQNDAAAIVQWDCHGGANQRWQWVDVGGGFHELVNQHSGKCLETYGWSTGDAAALSQWTCFGGANQRWRDEP